MNQMSGVSIGKKGITTGESLFLRNRDIGGGFDSILGLIKLILDGNTSGGCGGEILPENMTESIVSSSQLSPRSGHLQKENQNNNDNGGADAFAEYHELSRAINTWMGRLRDKLSDNYVMSNGLGKDDFERINLNSPEGNRMESGGGRECGICSVANPKGLKNSLIEREPVELEESFFKRPEKAPIEAKLIKTDESLTQPKNGLPPSSLIYGLNKNSRWTIQPKVKDILIDGLKTKVSGNEDIRLYDYSFKKNDVLSRANDGRVKVSGRVSSGSVMNRWLPDGEGGDTKAGSSSNSDSIVNRPLPDDRGGGTKLGEDFIVAKEMGSRENIVEDKRSLIVTLGRGINSYHRSGMEEDERVSKNFASGVERGYTTYSENQKEEGISYNSRDARWRGRKRLNSYDREQRVLDVFAEVRRGDGDFLSTGKVDGKLQRFSSGPQEQWLGGEDCEDFGGRVDVGWRVETDEARGSGVVPVENPGVGIHKNILSSVRKKIADEIQVMKGSGTTEHEVRLRLHPPHLGEVRIKISTEGNNLRLSLLVESDAVKYVVDSGADRLSESISQEGFVLEHLDVSSGNSGGGKEWDGFEEGLSDLGRESSHELQGRRRQLKPDEGSNGINIFA